MSNTKDRLTRVTTTLLPIDEIGELLRIKHGFITNKDKAADTEKVAGTDAELVAIAVSEDDRTTVNNALHLGGKPASSYLTSDAGSEIESRQGKMKDIYSNELRNLRDELYQLRSELAKKGIVNNYSLYEGFHDIFRRGQNAHLAEALEIVKEDSFSNNEVTLHEIYDDLDIEDFIVLRRIDGSKEEVVRVTDKDSNGLIRFKPAVSFQIRANEVEVRKSLGTVADGAFSFMKEIGDTPSSKEKYSVLNDDRYKTRRTLNTPNTGLGYTFRVADSMMGEEINGERRAFLDRIKLKVRKFNNPGALVVYVIHKDDIDKFKNPIQAEEDGIIVAKSQPTIPEHEVEDILEISFYDGEKYPILKNENNETRYCMIITAEKIDENNFYQFVLLRSQTGDLQLNNDLYEYNEQSTGSPDSALVLSDNDADLYYGIVTREILEKDVRPYREGIYTAQFETAEPIVISRARLMLRIAREGMFKTTNFGSVHDGDPVPYEQEKVPFGKEYDRHYLGGIGAIIDRDAVAVGTNIRNINSQDPDEVFVEKGLYTDNEGEPVYRIGYKAYLKAKLIEYDEATNRYEERDKVKIELPLTAIIPDRFKKDPHISDRILFENEFVDENGEAKYFNHFELQIHWKTGYGAALEDEHYKEDLIGRIHDLVLTFDKSI